MAQLFQHSCLSTIFSSFVVIETASMCKLVSSGGLRWENWNLIYFGLDLWLSVNRFAAAVLHYKSGSGAIKILSCPVGILNVYMMCCIGLLWMSHTPSGLYRKLFKVNLIKVSGADWGLWIREYQVGWLIPPVFPGCCWSEKEFRQSAANNQFSAAQTSVKCRHGRFVLITTYAGSIAASPPHHHWRSFEALKCTLWRPINRAGGDTLEWKRAEMR